MSSSSLLQGTFANPVGPLLLSMFTYTTVLAFTTPSSYIRTSALPLMFGYVYLSLTLPIDKHQFNHPMYPNMIGGTTCSMLLQYMDAILIRKLSFDTSSWSASQDPRKRQSPSKTPLGIGEAWQRVLFAFSSIFSMRGLGTSGQVKNIPTFSPSDPDYIPSRSSFLRKKAAQCLIHLLILDLTSLAARPPDDPEIFSREHVSFFTRLHNVSANELILRFITSAATGIVTYSLFQVIYCFSALVAVGLRLSDCASWPPLYQSPLDAWSIRQFWGAFWHQSVRLKLSTPSQHLTYNVFGLRRGSSAGRYLAIFLTFAASGLMHLGGDVTAGISWRESGVLQFYCTQALGVMMEDSAQALYHFFTRGQQEERPGTEQSDPAQNPRENKEKSLNKKPSQKPDLWKRLLGYVWVAVWMAWSMPVWTYPVSQRSEGESVLPFGVLRYLV